MIKPWQHGIPRHSRDVWLIAAASGLCSSAFLGMMQLLKVLYVLRLGYGPKLVGTLFAAGALSFSLSSLPGGALGARFGPRRMMVIGALINVLGMALLPFTEAMPGGWQRFWPFLVQTVSSSGWSMLMVNQVTALMSFTSPENRRGAYAVKEACAGLGMFMGALVGGLLPAAFASVLGATTEDPAPYRYGLAVAVGLGVLGLIPLTQVGHVACAQRSREETSAFPPLLPFALLLGCGFLTNGAVASCKAFASAYMDRSFGLPPSLIGAITSLGQLLAVVSALSGPRLARRRGSAHTMIVASLALAVGLLQMTCIPQWVSAGVGLAATLALSAMWVPAFQVLQMEMAEPAWRSLVSGGNAMAMSLGFGSVSFTGGYIVAAVGYRPLFLVGTMMATGSALLVSLLARQQEMAAAPRQAEPLGVARG